MLLERLALCAQCPAGREVFADVSKDQTTAVVFCPNGEDSCSVEAVAIHHQGVPGEGSPAIKTYAIVYGWCGLAHGGLGRSFFRKHIQIPPAPLTRTE